MLPPWHTWLALLTTGVGGPLWYHVQHLPGQYECTAHGKRYRIGLLFAKIACNILPYCISKWCCHGASLSNLWSAAWICYSSNILLLTCGNLIQSPHLTRGHVLIGHNYHHLGILLLEPTWTQGFQEYLILFFKIFLFRLKSMCLCVHTMRPLRLQGSNFCSNCAPSVVFTWLGTDRGTKVRRSSISDLL